MHRETTTASTLDASSPGSGLVRAALRWQHAANEALAGISITHSQLNLMSGLHDLSVLGDPVTQVRLCAHTSTDVMATSKALRVLEARGLVERRPHPTDTRARAVVLTKAGAAVLRKGLRIVATVDRSMFDDTPSTERLHRMLLAIAGGGR
jgi:DNA-binding MarR family transcriptional regulator